MADIFDPQKRHEIMASIRSKNSQAEVVVFKYLRVEKVYFQRHYKRALGCPDVALPRKKRAVFIDGDFWHGRTYEKLISGNRINGYWQNRLLKNMERDKTQRKKLTETGWAVLRVWESDILRKSTRNSELEKIKTFLTD